jgi:hypothetical protein
VSPADAVEELRRIVDELEREFGNELRAEVRDLVRAVQRLRRRLGVDRRV